MEIRAYLYIEIYANKYKQIYIQRQICDREKYRFKDDNTVITRGIYIYIEKIAKSSRNDIRRI